MSIGHMKYMADLYEEKGWHDVARIIRHTIRKYT